MGISVDPAEDSRELAKSLGLGFPLLGDADLAVADRYGVAMAGRDIAVPAVFVVTPDRAIIYEHVGETMMDRPPALEVMAALEGRLAR